MGLNVFQKIVAAHRAGSGNAAGVVPLKVDQVLTQDATGTMVYLQFEAIGLKRIKVPLAVSYVDHNTLQVDSRNPDDHRYLQTAAARFGAWFSPAGNGICHQLHLENFARPAQILLGSDSHTPTCGGMGMLAIGCGGLDIAAAMAGFPYELPRPRVRRIRLKGRLRKPWVTAMDVSLELLRRLTVRGGVGWVLEYDGPALSRLSLTERATICNLGAELGATSSLFPSDLVTREFLKARGREKEWRELTADRDAAYDEELEVDLGRLEPLTAQPFSPDNVVPLKDLEGLRVDQVCIGSCSNSSYEVLRAVAQLVKGKAVAPHLNLLINPGSRQVVGSLAADGSLPSLISAGARVLEASCGPCIGMGGAPPYDGVSFRSYNRNFKGRSGTPNARVFLVNPLAGALLALEGQVVDPLRYPLRLPAPPRSRTTMGREPLLQAPPRKAAGLEIIRGPNIKPIPRKKPVPEDFQAEVLIRLGDHVTTDDILPGGSEVLPFRSNIPAISHYTFSRLDPTFAERARQAGGGLIAGGENYGQGSSREHAALAPMFLGIQAVLAKSFARIHLNNLINYGILPLTFEDPEDYQGLKQGDRLTFQGVRKSIKKAAILKVRIGDRETIRLRPQVTANKVEVLLAGGLLPYLRKRINNQ
ncbi:MAG: aconitate hydratase [Deltaproteobacteria bacterium]|nr:aconitate hydratase [Deltaproteobacteria bacterium]